VPVWWHRSRNLQVEGGPERRPSGGSRTGAVSRCSHLFWGDEFLFHAADLVFHLLIPINAGSEPHARGNSRHADTVKHLMAALHSRKDGIPVSLNVGSVPKCRGADVGWRAGR